MLIAPIRLFRRGNRVGRGRRRGWLGGLIGSGASARLAALKVLTQCRRELLALCGGFDRICHPVGPFPFRANLGYSSPPFGLGLASVHRLPE